MKLSVIVLPTNHAVVIDVEPGVYNRAAHGATFFQARVIDLVRTQFPKEPRTPLTWDTIMVGVPESVG